MKKFFNRDILYRTIVCILGNIIIGLGVAITKTAAFGNDPFNGMCMAISASIGIAYTTYTLLFNTAIFIIEIIWGRKYINIGTFINWFLLCYAVSFFLPITERVIGYPSVLWVRLLVLLIGILVSSFGLALYQMADLGIAPYDAIPIMVSEKFPKYKFFWARITLDGISTILIFLFGGIVSLGTLVFALGLGPFIHFFTFLLKPILKFEKK